MSIARQPASRSTPPISVVVCTRDRPEQLASCLEAVLAQDYPCFDVLVVENAPRDDRTASVVGRLPVGYLAEGRPGLSNARNVGLASAKYPLIAFTDDDARPEPGWLRAIGAAFADPQVMAVTGLVLPTTLETHAQVVFETACGGMSKGTEPGTFHRDRLSARQLIATQRMGCGTNMAFRREVFRRVGAFDVRLGAGSPGRSAEDVDMFHRILVAGQTLRYEPAAVVKHEHRKAMEELERQLEDAAWGYVQYLRKVLGTRSVPRLQARIYSVRWYGWLAGRVIGRSLGLEKVPMRLLWRQLVTAIAA